ncbi:MAG: tetratricopeptide repeat protein [Thermodesulfobacteriota bacterium]
MKKIALISLFVAFTLAACGGGKKKTEAPEDTAKMFENQKALAVSSLWRGNFQQALKEIDDAEKINNKDPEVYVIKGAIYIGFKDYPIAEENFNKAIGLDKSYTPAHFNLCGLYLIEENYDRVITECGLVVADPTYRARANAYTNIGLAYFGKGDMTKARENYEQALKLNPAFVYAHNQLGKLYMSAGRYGEAVAEFQQAITGLPSYEEAYFNLGLAYLKLNNNLKACESFRKVEEISPSSEFGVSSNRYVNTICK